MLLLDLYDAATLDLFIGYSIEQDKMDIKSFKGLLRDYNTGKLGLGQAVPEPASETTGGSMEYREDDPALTRDCSYYETNAMMEVRSDGT